MNGRKPNGGGDVGAGAYLLLAAFLAALWTMWPQLAIAQDANAIDEFYAAWKKAQADGRSPIEFVVDLPREAAATFRAAFDERISAAEDKEKPGARSDYIFRGLLRHLTADDAARAAEDFTKAIELLPAIPDAYMYRGMAKSAQGEHAAALADLSKAVELDPQMAEAFLYRGEVRLKLGDFEGAVADFDHAIQLQPKQPMAFLWRGKARAMRGDFRGATADFDRAIELDPMNADAFLARGDARAQMGDMAGAIADFTRAIELNPNDARAYFSRAMAKLRNGDFQTALADLDRAIALDPNMATAYYTRAHTKARLGDAAGATADVERALALDPRMWQAWVLKGALLESDNAEAALAAYSHGYRICPSDRHRSAIAAAIRRLGGEVPSGDDDTDDGKE